MLRKPLYPPTSRYWQRTLRAVKAQALLVGAFALLTSGAAFAGPCTGAGATPNTQTKCVTAIAITGSPLVSFDISWVNPDRAEYYLGDRSNAGIDIIDTKNLKFLRTIGGFKGVVLKPAPAVNLVDSNHSGPDGVVSHGRWLYAGDGDSSLKVIDLDAPTATAIKQTIFTGGTTRVDEMDLTTDGGVLLAANNAEDPPFGTLFKANFDNNTSAVSILSKITVDSKIMPTGLGLSIEQPVWDPTTKRFYVSVPQINVPAGCTPFAAVPPQIPCAGGLLIIDPTTVSKPTAVIGVYDSGTNTGVLALNQCGPNGAAVGPHDNLLLGCTPANLAGSTSTLVINAKTKHFLNLGGITGSDEVWFNPGDNRYYTGSSANPASLGGPALGVISGETNLLIETILQGSGSHSVAADARRNRIFVPQVVPKCTTGVCPPGSAGADTTGVSAQICGTTNGCVAVYEHDVDDDHDHGDHDHGDHDR
jgi:hypothetical protein